MLRSNFSKKKSKFLDKKQITQFTNLDENKYEKRNFEWKNTVLTKYH